MFICGITRASGTTRGSAVSRPGTSFHSVTRLAPSARPSRVAVRSVPPRPSVTSDGGSSASARPVRDPGSPGTTGIDPGRQQRAQPLAGGGVGRLQVGRRAAEGPAGDHHLERVDVFRLDPRLGQGGHEQPGAQPLAARHDQVAGARRQLAQHRQAAGHGLQLDACAASIRSSSSRPARVGRASSRRMAAYFSRRVPDRRRAPASRPRPGPSRPPPAAGRSPRPGAEQTDHQRAPRSRRTMLTACMKGGAVAQRRAPELVDLRTVRLFGAWIDRAEKRLPRVPGLLAASPAGARGTPAQAQAVMPGSRPAATEVLGRIPR